MPLATAFLDAAAADADIVVLDQHLEYPDIQCAPSSHG